jgi:hypothetical protein
MGSIIILKRDWSYKDKNALKFTIMKFFSSFDELNLRHHNIMRMLWEGKPNWVYKICQMFLCYYEVFLNNLILESCNLYLKIPNVENVDFIHIKSIEACFATISAADALGECFFRYGVVFRLYCLSHSILGLGKILFLEESFIKRHNTNSEYNDKVIKSYIEKGMTILSNSTPYFSVAKEFLNIIRDLMFNPNKFFQ